MEQSKIVGETGNDATSYFAIPIPGNGPPLREVVVDDITPRRLSRRRRTSNASLVTALSPFKAGLKRNTINRRTTWPLRTDEPTGCTTTDQIPLLAKQSQLIQNSDIHSNIFPLCPHEQPTTPLSPAPSLQIDQVNGFWESYNRKADFEDREFVKALGASLDVLLIFAGLFSGVNTAFIVESMKSLQTDQAEKTNQLLETIILTLQNAPIPDHTTHVVPFLPTKQAVRSNVVFFASLCCSLTAAFGAVLGKQWLTHYEREGGIKPPADRARERQKKYQGRDKWHLEGVIESLPTILQLSLYLFLAGLIDFLWPMNTQVAGAIIAFALVPFLFYILTTGIATFNSSSPFQTRLSILLREVQFLKRLWARVKATVSRKGDEWRDYEISNHVVEWIRHLPDTLPAILAVVFPQLRRLIRSLFHHVSRTVSWRYDTPNLSSASDRYNLGCIVFSMKRASTPQDLDAVHSAIKSLAPQLQIDRNDPIVAGLVEAIVNFWIKPTWSRGQVLWENAKIDLQPLLNVLYLIFVHWDYFRDHSLPDPGTSSTYHYWETYTVQFFQMLQAELWSVFSRDPLHIKTATMIADIMPHVGEYQCCSQEQLDTLLDCFKNVTGDPSNKLPYIKLLFGEVYYSSSVRSIVESDGVPQALISTMWDTEGKADLDYHRGRLRVDWVPVLLKEDSDKRDFGRYLLEWFNEHSELGSGNSMGMKIASQVLESYLQSLCHLLEDPSYPVDQLWLQYNAWDDHPSCLLRILTSKAVVSRRRLSSGNASGRVTALHCLMTIWHWHCQDCDNGDRQNFVKQPSVNAVIDCLAWLRRLDDEVFYAETLGWYGNNTMIAIIHFLQEASSLGLLRRSGMAFVEGYKRLGDQFLEAEECQGLYERLKELVSS